MMIVTKLNGALAVELPDSVVEALDIKEGDDIALRVSETGIFDVERRPSRADWIERLRRFQGMLPPDFKFNRGEANER